jgi:hypothetical protein
MLAKPRAGKGPNDSRAFLLDQRDRANLAQRNQKLTRPAQRNTGHGPYKNAD